MLFLDYLAGIVTGVALTVFVGIVRFEFDIRIPMPWKRGADSDRSD
ncbi:MAG TPA: hypothetical protein VGG51_04185 [Candidatus Cybelea sp.]|jgi:hypothetical protein